MMEKKDAVKIIGDAIRAGRKKRGWTQKKLASFLGFDTTLISKWETYRTVPTGDDLLRLAIELDIVPLLFAQYFPDIAIAPPTLREELDQIKHRLGKIEEKVSI